jgi:hypothetical protein
MDGKIKSKWNFLLQYQGLRGHRGCGVRLEKLRFGQGNSKYYRLISMTAWFMSNWKLGKELPFG